MEELAALWAYPEEFQVRWAQWPVELAAKFAGLLIRAYPLAADPPLKSGFVTPDTELRTIRNRLIESFLNNAQPESQMVLDQFAAIDEGVERWVSTYRASQRASEVLRDADPIRSTIAVALNVPDAVRVLERGGFRLVRSVDDLFDAVLESLTQVKADVGHDLPMLYGSPTRRRRKPDTAEPDKQVRKHLEEDALQAYLRRRLSDQLRRIVDVWTWLS